MNRSRPPFEVVPGQSPAEAAAEIVAVFAAVARRPDKMQWVERETARAISVDPDPQRAAPAPALARATRAIAVAVDADAPTSDRSAYHNRQHLCEVVLVACFLARLHRLPPHGARRLLLAALIHDLDHDGAPGGDFAPERRSLARATPFLREAGVDADECRRLGALVLATEPREGTRRALAAVSGKARGTGLALAPELDALDEDASLGQLALLLCEADLLPSVGLTPAHGHVLQERLAEEWGRPLGRADKRRFIDGVLADGIVGGFFRPNVLAFRDLLEATGDGPTAR